LADQPTKKNPNRKRKQRSRKPAAQKRAQPQGGGKPLPPPIDVPSIDSQRVSQPASQASYARSSTSSTPSYDAPDAPIDERLLAAIPDVISDTGEDIPSIEGGVIDEGGAASLSMDAICDAETLADLLQTGFGWVADFRNRECYRLDDRKATRLADPWTPVINTWWQKLAPMLLQQFALANPGLVAAILTTAVVVGPMVSADLKQTSEERAARRKMVQPGTSHNARVSEMPSQPTRNGMIWAEGATQPA
jgi:hypothetical protein